MSDEMKNSTTPYNKSTGLQGIGDSVKLMNEYDMNKLNDPIGKNEHGKTEPGRYSKNS